MLPVFAGGSKPTLEHILVVERELWHIVRSLLRLILVVVTFTNDLNAISRQAGIRDCFQAIFLTYSGTRDYAFVLGYIVTAKEEVTFKQQQ